MKKIIVLGSGLVGSVMANDLAEDYEVTSVDVSPRNLEKISSEKINKICADVTEKDVLENLKLAPLTEKENSLDGIQSLIIADKEKELLKMVMCGKDIFGMEK